MNIDWQQEGALVLNAMKGEPWHGVTLPPCDPIAELARFHDEKGLPIDMMYCFMQEKGLDIDSDYFAALVKRGVDYRQGRIRGGQYI